MTKPLKRGKDTVAYNFDVRFIYLEICLQLKRDSIILKLKKFVKEWNKNWNISDDLM
jgi:hypothetical protein